MRLYRTYAEAMYGDGLTQRAEARWAGSQAEAASQRRHINVTKKVPRDHIHTDEVEVPTSKKELLAWLNEHCRG